MGVAPVGLRWGRERMNCLWEQVHVWAAVLYLYEISMSLTPGGSYQASDFQHNSFSVL